MSRLIYRRLLCRRVREFVPDAVPRSLDVLLTLSLSIDTEVDMNTELIAHGYSNLLSGCVGGLQNYMAYTQSVIYDKSGGTGKA